MRILRNSIRTPDGTILTSTSVHDYVEHIDANGELYMIDGGNQYLRRSINKVPPVELSLTDDLPLMEIRGIPLWGTYGQNYDNFHRVAIKDMSNAHLEAIIDDGYEGPLVDYMGMELRYRHCNNIIVEDK